MLIPCLRLVGVGQYLCDSLGRSERIKYYCCHHEQAVSMAAEGYARTSGRPGVCLVTSGPGGTNAITGAACAWADSIPQIIISGQVYLHQTIGESGLRQLGVQETNIIDLVKPITKYAEMVKDPEDILLHWRKRGSWQPLVALALCGWIFLETFKMHRSIQIL